MLSKEVSRRLAQLERQLRRDDPEFCARMADDKLHRAPMSVPPAAVVIWVAALVLGVAGWWIVAALVLGVAGWWIAAAIASLWATVLVFALALRLGPSRHRSTG